MSTSLIFWAQALDNRAPDHFSEAGELLSDTQTARRQEAAARVSEVIRTGARVFEEGHVTVTANATHFVLEVPSAQTDVTGRTAPIISCGSATDELLEREPIVGLQEFATLIGRQLSDENIERARRGLDRLKKKLRMRLWQRRAGYAAVFLAILFLLLRLLR